MIPLLYSHDDQPLYPLEEIEAEPHLFHPVNSITQDSGQSALTAVSPEYKNIQDLKTMVSMQSYYPVDASEGLAFLIRGREVVAMHSVKLDQRYTLHEWRRQAAGWITAYADTQSGILINPQNLPLTVRRHACRIATRSRRGWGNVIVASSKGLDLLHLYSNDKETQYTDTHYRIVKFQEGEIFPYPFAVIGYAGPNPYDHSIVLALTESKTSKFTGGFAFNQPSNYWSRIL